MASAKVTYIFRRSTISELVFSRLKRFETVNIRHKIMEDIHGDRPIEKIDIPRRFPPITALESCRPVVVPSLSFKAFDKSTKGREILLPKTEIKTKKIVQQNRFPTSDRFNISFKLSLSHFGSTILGLAYTYVLLKHLISTYFTIICDVSKLICH